MVSSENTLPFPNSVCFLKLFRLVLPINHFLVFIFNIWEMKEKK